jgi:hypothetical protein
VWGDDGLCVKLQDSKDMMPFVYILDVKASLIKDLGAVSAHC